MPGLIRYASPLYRQLLAVRARQDTPFLPEQAVRVERTARAIISIGGQVLLARGKGESYAHLPGGHVETGENPADALKRELREELKREVSDLRFITVIENVFNKGNMVIREQMHLFKATLYPLQEEMPPQSKEDHLEFFWCPIQDLRRVNLLPPVLDSWITIYGGV